MRPANSGVDVALRDICGKSGGVTHDRPPECRIFGAVHRLLHGRAGSHTRVQRHETL
jgi:hypothetical protein